MGGNEYLAMVVGVAMTANMMVAGISGVVVPLGLRAIRVDPRAGVGGGGYDDYGCGGLPHISWAGHADDTPDSSRVGRIRVYCRAPVVLCCQYAARSLKGGRP